MKKINLCSIVVLIVGIYLLGFGVSFYEHDFIIALASMLLGTFIMIESLGCPRAKNF
jgi:hypothetical protein